jgi:uncharacterized membrane protein (DUF2068 family)
MDSDLPPPLQPPILPANSRKREAAPTLYGIIILKLFVGVILLFAGLALYAMRNEDLQTQVRETLTQATLGLGTAEDIDKAVALFTPANIQILAVGMFGYALLSVVQGVGLICRAAWAGWLVIIESAIFIPVEVWDLFRQFSVLMLLILVLNIAICWYLLASRHRLFGGPP